jgi:hypothetical protein
MVIDEERPVGNVKWQTYKLYIVAATYVTWFLVIIALGESRFHLLGSGLISSYGSGVRGRRAILVESMGRG